MRANSGDNIQCHHEYMRCYSNLVTAYDKAETSKRAMNKLLSEYCEFTINNWDSSFPLLLKEGRELPLNRQPSHIYLLPPVSELPETERLILCQFPKESKNEQGFQLIRWLSSEIQSKLTNNIPFWKIETIESTSFVEKINEITLTEMGDKEYLLRLSFDHVMLRIMFSLDSSDKIQSKWIKKPSGNTGSFYWERESHGDMQKSLRIQQNEDKNTWRDDDLILKNDVKVDHKLGHITGVDSPKNSSSLYLASNTAFIYSFDQTPHSQHLVKSPKFSGICHDVLCIPHPEGEEKDAIITPCSDGSVWVLENNRKELKVLHYQITSEKIVRIIGFGTAHIVVLDHLHRLIPIHVNQVGKHRKQLHVIRRFLWKKVYENKKNQVPWDHNTEAYRDKIARVAMAQYLDCLVSDTGKNIPISDDELSWIESLFTDINQYDEKASKGLVEKNFLTHERLLGKIWGSLRSLLYMHTMHPETTGRLHYASIKVSTKYWVPFWMLVELDKNAPTPLWLNVFRHHDWVELLVTTLSGKNRGKTKSLHENLKSFITDIAKKRHALAADFSEYRSILVHSSMRLASQPRHIREFNAEKRLICYMDYQKGLHITKLPLVMQDTWQDKLALKHGKYWQGIPRTIVTGDRLRNLFPKAQFPTIDSPLFIATNRGELCLLSIQHKKAGEYEERLISKKNIPVDVRVCHSVMHKGKCIGIMLGGRNTKRQATILWIRFTRGNKDSPFQVEANTQTLWTDNNKGGVLRMLNVIGSKHSKTLWATVQNLGELHTWSVAFIPQKGNVGVDLTLQKHQRVIVEQNGLQALAVDDYEDPKKIITGGKDGIAIAYKYQASNNPMSADYKLMPDWVMGCGKHMNRAIYMVNKEGTKKYWLLCSDHSDLQVVNTEKGCLESVIEHLGAITAARRLKSKDGIRAIIGTARGRIVQLTFSTRHHSSSHSTQKTKTLPALVLKANKPEMLALMENFSLIINNNNGNIPKWVNSLSPTLFALCIKLNEQEPHPKLIQAAWNNIHNAKANDLICRLAAVLLVFAENWKLSKIQPSIDTLTSKIYQDLLSCLWDTPAKNACPVNFQNESKRSILRLGQAFRLMPKERHINEAEARLINTWLRKLATISSAEHGDELSQLKTNLKSLLGEKIPLWSPAWQKWLNQLVENIPAQRIPTPISNLWINAQQLPPFFTKTLTSLEQEFDSIIWRNWLKILQEILQQRLKESHATPHIAWQEKSRLYQLQQHFIDTGQKDFVEPAFLSLPLVALFWFDLSRHWEKIIDQRISYLDTLLIDKNYLNISYKLHWETAKKIEVNLTIINNSSRNINIEHGEYYPLGNQVKVQEIDLHGSVVGASQHGFTTTFTLETQQDNQIRGRLDIEFSEAVFEENIHHSVSIEEKRGIHQFRDSAGYDLTDSYLIKILTQPSRTHIRWIDGNYWSNEDRQHIYDTSKQILNKESRIVKISQLNDALDNEEEYIFCPDLPLSSNNPNILIHRFHTLLHSLEQQHFSFLALSLWHWATPLPQDVINALGSSLISPPRCERLVNRLFYRNKETIALLKIGLQELEHNAALGAWCAGEPLNNNGIYPNSASLVGKSLWKQLIHHNIDTWPNPIHETQRRLITELLNINNLNKFSTDLAQALTASLGGSIYHAPSKLWKLEQPITVLEVQYECCWLLPPKLADFQLHFLASQDECLWLQLGKETAVNLHGKVLNINFMQCLRLLFIKPNHKANWDILHHESEAHELLSEWAALKSKAKPHKIFKTENGMAAGAEIRHFIGRSDEITFIKNILTNADNNTTGDKGVVILGSRRLGKTSLRQHITANVTDNSPERLIFDLDCSRWLGTDLTPAAIEKNFFRACQREIIIKYKSIDSFTFNWQYSNISSQQTLTRQKFEDFLISYKDKTGYASLLIFDETDMLMAEGLQRVDDLFSWIRSLMSAGILAWVITGFPRGNSLPNSLQAQLLNSSSSIHNTIKCLTLSSWKENETWRFLRSRLALLGIRLPREYKDDVWRTTQGLPWVVHSMGEMLAKYQHVGRRTLISPAEWTDVVKQSNEEVQAVFETSITNTCREVEKLQSIKLNSRQLHSDGRLVEALRELARERDASAEQTFSFSDVCRKVGNKGNKEVLKDILNQLTNSPMISGTNFKETYKFAGGAYPRLFSFMRKR